MYSYILQPGLIHIHTLIIDYDYVYNLIKIIYIKIKKYNSNIIKKRKWNNGLKKKSNQLWLG